MDEPPLRLVQRFSGAERTLHWVYALLFVILLLSGLFLYLGPGQNPFLDRRELMRGIHLDAALALVALFLLVAAGSPGTLRRLRDDVEWFDRDDARWLLWVLVPRRLRGRPLPPQRRLNAGQKLNTVLTAAATVGFTVTGRVRLDFARRRHARWAETLEQGEDTV